MRIYHALEDVPADFGPSAVSIGNFDGVHEGHRRILRRVRETASVHGWRASVLTFDPHPTRIVAPAKSPKLMTLPEQRCSLMAEEGIEQVLILPFTESVSLLSPEEFARRILVEKLRVRAAFVGDNFRFGHKASGDIGTLRELGAAMGFTVEIVHGVRVRGRMVSSTGIRGLIQAGEVSRACRHLGKPFALEGDVVSGFGIGSKQTVPTLNLKTVTELLPANGVYVTRTRDLEAPRTWNSITNVGHRPTFEGQALTIETFLLDPFDGVTPKRIAVEFLLRVREERKFASPEELKAQILKDVGRAQTYFRRRAKA